MHSPSVSAWRSCADAPVSLRSRSTSGGAVLVEQKIDQLVTDGKITALQGEMLKEAARRSYEALQAKLTELSVKDVAVEVSE